MSSCDNHYGAQCNFSCAIGYSLNGSSTVTCVAPGDKPPGSWDSPLPSCDGRLYIIYSLCNQANFFQLILIVQKVKHSGSRRNQGLIICYFMQFVFSSLSVAITCQALLAPSYGFRRNCSGTTIEYYNTVCLFFCKAGFNGYGSSSRQCQEDGTWSGQDFICTGKIQPKYCSN